MAGVRKKPIHPFVQELLDNGLPGKRDGFSSVEELARFLVERSNGRVTMPQARYLADGSGSPETHYWASKAVGIPTDKWLEKFYKLDKQQA